MRTKGQKKTGTFLFLAGIFLMGMAIALTAHNFWESYRSGVRAENILQQAEKIENVQNTEAEILPLYLTNPDMEMPVMEIDDHRYIGRVDIPVLGVSLPVMEEWSDSNLAIAPCRYSGSVYKDNMVIAAHNYRSQFGSIKNLKVGDEVSFTDADGNCFYYQVAEMEQLKGTAVEEMQAGDWDLTLFTCTLGGKYRTTIRCVREDN